MRRNQTSFSKLEKDYPVKHKVTEAEQTGRVAPYPAGYVKVMEALRLLLREKDFNAVTWAEIAQTAGVNEALIYKYFKDKRGLLHKVLHDYLEDFLAGLDYALKGIKGSFNKLRKIAWFQIDLYNKERVFSRILLLEVRNYTAYFQSETYDSVRKFSNIILDVIEEGIHDGEIRDDIQAKHIRQIFLGAIEHMCLPGVIYDKDLSPDAATESICEVLFPGLQKKAG